MADSQGNQEWWMKPIPQPKVSKKRQQEHNALLAAWSEAWGEHLRELYAQAEEDFTVGRIQEIGDDLKQDNDDREITDGESSQDDRSDGPVEE